jgi:ribosomal protein S18 acetylase RimI-like enzyme
VFPDELGATLAELHDAKCRLAYWAVPALDRERVGAALDHGSFHAAEKLTYVSALNMESVPAVATRAVVPFGEAHASDALVHLAIRGAEHSRFRRDPLFPQALCDQLYATWIERSVTKEIADETLVVRDGRNLLGLITLGRAGDRGDIGLVAVDPIAQGQGIGRLLVTEAGRRLAAAGRRHVQVVTQGSNVPACRLYKSCGYSIESAEAVFHFWL